ncbi:MAG TPA: hypothetical protein VI078_14875 [bacterium]
MNSETDDQFPDPEVAELASEVMSFLEKHPQAADTSEHIARWWILRQRVEVALAKTSLALDYLEARGLVERGVGGVYRLVRGRHRCVQAPMHQG